MEKESKFNREDLEVEIEVVGGKKYRKVPSGYTMRQYFSHITPEKGPGPGWDTRWRILEKYDVNDPSKLPDEPYYLREEIKDDE